MHGKAQISFIMANVNKSEVLHKKQIKLKALVNDPAFDKPISHLKKEYTGTLILVTRIKP